MKKPDDLKLIENGKRIDGRDPLELRNIEMKVGVVERADGSALVRFGRTAVVASVYGPRPLYPRYLQEYESCILRCRYAMVPFSVDERKSPGPDRRSIELSKIIRVALEPAIFLEEFPRTVIDVFIDVLEADGSTRVTGINAASLALAIAGVPMRDLVAACSVGKVEDTLVVDLCGKEDNYSQSDVCIAFMPGKNKITLLQMDGMLTEEELKKLIKIGKDKCMEIYKLQKKALRKAFEVV